MTKQMNLRSRFRYYLITYALFIVVLALFIWANCIPIIDQAYYHPPIQAKIDYGWPFNVYTYLHEEVPYHRDPINYVSGEWNYKNIAINGLIGLGASLFVSGLLEVYLRTRDKNKPIVQNPS